MFETTGEATAVMSICTRAPASSRAAPLVAVSCRTGRRALNLLKTQRFDLLLIGPEIGDLPLWELLRQIRTSVPALPWVFVEPAPSDQGQNVARLFKAAAVVAATPSAVQIAGLVSRLREQAAAEFYRQRTRVASA